jgi:hypothetical protein
MLTAHTTGATDMTRKQAATLHILKAEENKALAT